LQRKKLGYFTGFVLLTGFAGGLVSDFIYGYFGALEFLNIILSR
jgi:hypothetical protein